MSGEAEPSLGSQPEAFPTLGGRMIGQNGACGLGGLDEARPIGKCSRVLDRSDELALMGINSSSSGTLVLVPDSSPRAPGRFK